LTRFTRCDSSPSHRNSVAIPLRRSLAARDSRNRGFSTEERHRAEDRLPERAGIDANRSIEAIRERLTARRAPRGIPEAREIGKAERDIDGNDSLLARRERQPERELRVGGARVFEVERPLERPERETERVRVADLRPQANPCTAKWTSAPRTEQPDFSALTWRLLETWRLHERAEPVQLGTRLKHQQRHDRNDQSRSHTPSKVQDRRR
jgi:hypothetical protein